MERKSIFRRFFAGTFFGMGILSISGWKLSPRQRFIDHVKSKISLSDDEKAYAIRVFDYVNSKEFRKNLEADDEDNPVDPTDISPNITRKWGVGKNSSLFEEEKTYLCEIEQMINLWKAYNEINMSDLAEGDRNWLKQTHIKYGNGNVNLKDAYKKEKGKLDETQRQILDLAEVVCGRKKLNDRALVLVKHISNAVEEE